MEEERTVEKVKEMLQRYSSRGGTFSEGSFLSDIDAPSDISFTSWEEELTGRIIKSLKYCKEMTEMARRRKGCISRKEVIECMSILDSIKRNIEEPREVRKGWIILAVSVGIGLIGIAYVSAKHCL
ncbi:hypothetical protein EROM_071140 [Encephalitozoon romaleae SJ-2008]|uniref:Uncharacterized protein n=1 Tax=Encephalitozoon romaleae (strain SJ-2008) TaxID=1178016 RepID=I7AF96_ENCRO|nr:hypothetical protein EROM_071140 [Encephalitozoon romaleae SJ-2008]AFN83365.1 hypothetical protein EROM_071140 [Encephalitozoon romaleae SJ-2008]